MAVHVAKNKVSPLYSAKRMTHRSILAITTLAVLQLSCRPSEAEHKHPLPTTSQELITLYNNTPYPSLLTIDLGGKEYITFAPILDIDYHPVLFVIHNDHVRMGSGGGSQLLTDAEFHHRLDLLTEGLLLSGNELVGGMLAFSPDLTEKRLRTILTAFSERGLNKIIICDRKAW